MVTLLFNLESYSFNRICEPTGYCTGSTETGVLGGSTGSAVKYLVGGSTALISGLCWNVHAHHHQQPSHGSCAADHRRC